MAPLGNCDQVTTAAAMVFIVYRASTCAIFYARVRAVYSQSITMKALFALLWCFSVGGAITSPFSETAIRILPTKFCIPKTIGRTWELVFMVAAEAIYDLLVCAAVTYKIREYRIGENRGGSCFGGPWLFSSNTKDSRLADRFLRDSQMYFL